MRSAPPNFSADWPSTRVVPPAVAALRRHPRPRVAAEKTRSALLVTPPAFLSILVPRKATKGFRRSRPCIHHVPARNEDTPMTTRPINGFFPVLIQSRFGARGNFELVTTHSGAGTAD